MTRKANEKVHRKVHWKVHMMSVGVEKPRAEVTPTQAGWELVPSQQVS